MIEEELNFWVEIVGLCYMVISMVCIFGWMEVEVMEVGNDFSFFMLCIEDGVYFFFVF